MGNSRRRPSGGPRSILLALECSIVPGHEVKAIVDFAAQGGFDLLVVGFTGHSAAYEHLWGGTSHNLTRMAPCSVLVVK